MCGIFGIVTSEEQELGKIMIEAGYRLSYRGYDSVGCAVIDQEGVIDLRKDVGKIDEVAARLKFAELVGNRGILQLRWATFGTPSQENAQPHLDSGGRMVGAHNGNVVNNLELRQQFIAEGMIVRSQNDGESCVHAVERYINRNLTPIDAIQHAYRDLKGDYAFVIGKVDEDCIHAIKKGSGLVVGIGEGFTVISSDLPSLLPLTRQIIRINDGEIVSLWADRIELRSVVDGSLIQRSAETVSESMEAVQKGGYAHFMLKEIYEQPVAAGELIHMLNASTDIETFITKMSGARNLFLVGCGTSYHACLLGAVYLSRLAGRVAIPILAPQFIAQYGHSLHPDDVGIFVSQSGETKDVLNAVEIAAAKKMTVLGLVNVIGSTLMQASQSYLPLTCGYEISVPATKTYTNQVITFLYLALRMGGHPVSPLQNLPELMTQAIEEAIPQVSAISGDLAGHDDLYCLGYGLTYPVALEGSLKLKEITYAHCEGMLSTEFKHGPLSAVYDGYPVIFVAGMEDIPLLISGINETTCRGGHAIAIGSDDARLRDNANHLIVIPDCSAEVQALIAIIPLQVLSYQISLARGFNPDFPRNLSKTLTVD